MIKVLFVCLGNICRSPTAHGVFQTLVDNAGLDNQVRVDSCGTAAWHIGKTPDPRSTDAASSRGYDLRALRARQLCEEDFSAFDYILAMDESNLTGINALKPNNNKAHISLLLDYSPFDGYTEVPDPYYGGNKGFEIVLDLIESACKQLLEIIMLRLNEDQNK